jgi:hypothetical protein
MGSVSNGMLTTNTYSVTDSVAYSVTAGKQYRAIVTVYAGNSTGNDKKDFTTSGVYA